MKRTRNAVRNVIFGGLLKGYQILVPFIMRTLLIRYLGMEYLGLNSLFTSILQILNLAELGVGSALGYSVVDAWMASPTHAANILADDFTTCSIAVYETNGKLYFAQEFGY